MINLFGGVGNHYIKIKYIQNVFWFCYICLEMCSAVLQKFLRLKKNPLKQFVMLKIFCSASDKFPVVVDSTCTLTVWIYADWPKKKKKTTWENKWNVNVRGFQKQLFPHTSQIKLTVLLYKSKVGYLGGQTRKSKGWVTFAKGTWSSETERMKGETFKIQEENEKWAPE